MPLPQRASNATVAGVTIVTCNRHAQRRSAGFTMIELVTVIVVMGILSAIAAAKFFNNSGFETREYFDQSKAIIRYGQKLAIAQNRFVYVSATGNRFALCFTSTCASGSEVPAPGGSNSGSTVTKAQCNANSKWMCEGKPTSVVLGSSRGTEAGTSSAFFFFDRMGRPFSASDAINPDGTASSFKQPLTMTISGGSNLYTIVVEAETGYVH